MQILLIISIILLLFSLLLLFIVTYKLNDKIKKQEKFINNIDLNLELTNKMLKVIEEEFINQTKDNIQKRDALKNKITNVSKRLSKLNTDFSNLNDNKELILIKIKVEDMLKEINKEKYNNIRILKRCEELLYKAESIIQDSTFLKEISLMKCTIKEITEHYDNKVNFILNKVENLVKRR